MSFAFSASCFTNMIIFDGKGQKQARLFLSEEFREFISRLRKF